MKSEKVKEECENTENNRNKPFIFLFIISLFTINLSLFTLRCFADEPKTVITADKLEYFGEVKKYVATGSVTIERDGAVLRSAEITYYEDSSETVIPGHLTYNDPETSITAEKAEMNLDAKTGRLVGAEVFYKKYNYHISGREIEKRGEDYYFSPDATFTTCDAPVPAWCFKGRDVNAVIDKRLTSRDTTFRIKDLPVFYTPYLWASLIKERQTGLLMPLVSNSSTRGFSLSLPFYWAISENRDATLVLDGFSKRGIGTGLEYRFIEQGGSSGNWWAYHIRDTELDKDFWEVRGSYENRHPDGLGGYLNVNYIDYKDFYQVYSSRWDVKIMRYLESVGELNLPLPDSRLYLLSQYSQDLKNDTSVVPQRLPEVGYVRNYSPLGDFMLSASLTAGNFWSEKGVSAGRMDIYPRILHSMGKDFVVTQSVALRDTAYSYYGEQDPGKMTQRAAFEYDVTGHTRLYKKYSSFTHIIEPSVGYHFIYSSDNALPVLDSAELYGKTSNVELSVLNRGLIGGRQLFAIRLTQPLDTYNGNRPFLPLILDMNFNTPLPLTLEARYDVNTGKIETLTSDVGFKAFDANFVVGERYDRQEDVLMYTTYVAFSPHRLVQMTGQLWYDAKGGGLRNLTINMRYKKQCWGFRVEAVKTPGDFTMKVLFDLTGLSSRSPRGLPGYSPTL
ncbi:MAG: putative LPS assembly protein LptD [Nitrospiraceae bacterium]|nr:putative LPS assembly protein LptD [Nitrospiraceae bacterium]